MHSLLAFTPVSASSPTARFFFCRDLIGDRQCLQTEAIRRVREYARRTCGNNKQVRHAGTIVMFFPNTLQGTTKSKEGAGNGSGRRKWKRFGRIAED